MSPDRLAEIKELVAAIRNGRSDIVCADTVRLPRRIILADLDDLLAERDALAARLEAAEAERDRLLDN
jgi:hypothetical protein